MGRWMALDIGDRRIGVAVSDPIGMVARPLTTVVRASRANDLERISSLVDEHAIECLVIGLPLSLDGSEGPQARHVRRYAERLAASLPVPFEFWDERFSSTTAQELLRRKGRRRPSRGEIDAAAAAVILQSFLDSRGPFEEQVFPGEN